MTDYTIHPSKLKGSLSIPSSKSHTLRAILFAAVAHGKSCIEHYLPSPDTWQMIEAVRLLGAHVDIQENRLIIQGFAGKPSVPDDVIHCGNSGQVLRFIGALAGLIPGYTLLTGDDSIRHRRPVKSLLDGLNQLGAFGVSSRGDDKAPLLIKGPFTKGMACVDGADSQPISGLLIAAAFSPHPVQIDVTNPGEKPWIDVTLHWFRKLGIAYEANDYRRYCLPGSSNVQGFTYKVPGDFSTAAFPLAAALLTDSELTLHNLDMDDVQGDKAIIPLLEQMGACFIIDKAAKTVTVKKGAKLKGRQIDVNDFIDALPVLAVLASKADSPTEIMNGGIGRMKESDRISSIATELKKMGVRLEEKPDGLLIYPSKLRGARLECYHDHRLALSLSTAALAAETSSIVCGIDCMTKTYPGFYEDFCLIGAQITK